jgi:O-antigen/teichoic acid export membrane protein
LKTTHTFRRQLIKSFMGVGAMYALSIPLGLLTSIILARTLGPQGFGQYAFVMSLLSLLALPAAGGLPQVLTREVAASAHSGNWPLYRGVVRAAHVWVLVVATVIMILYCVVGPMFGLIPIEGKWALLGIVILLVPLEGLNAVRNGTIKGLGFPALAEFPTQTIRPVLLLLALALLAWLGQLSARSALWAQVVITSGTFIVASILFFRIRPKASMLSRPVYRSRVWLVALLPFTLISLVGTFNAQLGIVLLGLLGTDEAVAALRVAERGAQFVALSLGLVNMVISPHIVRTYQAGNIQHLQQLSRQSARGSFLIALPIGLVLVVFGKGVIQLAFGEDYVETAYLPMVILVLGQLFNVALGSVGILLVMSGYEKMTLWGQLAGLCAAVTSAVILIPLYQVIGAATAVSIGMVIWNIMLGYSVVRYLKIRPGIL